MKYNCITATFDNMILFDSANNMFSMVAVEIENENVSLTNDNISTVCQIFLLVTNKHLYTTLTKLMVSSII